MAAYTTIDDSSAFFQTALYTGNGSTQSITNDGNSDMQPDWVWIKSRSNASWHSLQDSSRGATKTLFSNTTNAEVTYTNAQTSFDSDGFSLAADSSGGSVNVNSRTYVAWQWKANGGTTSSNTEGNVTNTLQVNQDAGFSISKFTSTNSGNTTIGHGLGVTPDVFITKIASGTSGWWINHKGLTNRTDQYLGLNVAQAVGTVSWGAAPTSTLITMAPAFINNGTTTVMCYAFAEKQGFSKFGTYVGNGEANNGPFVYLGFKPAFVMIKSTTATGGHLMWDLKRSPFNLMDDIVNAAEADAESTNGIYGIDVLSNGFKIKNTGANNGTNQAGTKYVYYAFAENPFVTSTGIPTTAR